MVDTTSESATDPIGPGHPAGINWADPNVPAGDAPPLPRWPLYGGILIWCGWIAFLAAMVMMRLQSSP